VWKYSYYGDIFPRAFYLKAVGGASPERGLRYFYAFLMSYNLAPFLFFCLFFFGAIFRRENRTQFVMAGTVLLWFAYVLKVGGDFMEFRFLVPVLPPMMILLVWLLFGCTRRTWLRAAGVLLVLGGSLHHALTFSYDRGTGVEPVGMLRGHLSAPDENWTGIGEALAAAFTPADGVTIATTAAGAIPYYSGLKSVDMLGLNEPSEKPRDGSGDGDEGGPESVQVGYVTGHQRVVTYDYLNRRGVNLVISHPIVTKPGDPPAPLPLLPTGGPPHMSGKLLLMSIGDGYSVEMLYIRPNAAIDSAIARHGWPARPVVL
jgi:arabinofuranosyltransferase